jgi:hypothetical protein
MRFALCGEALHPRLRAHGLQSPARPGQLHGVQPERETLDRKSLASLTLHISSNYLLFSSHSSPIGDIRPYFTQGVDFVELGEIWRVVKIAVELGGGVSYCDLHKAFGGPPHP